ncbi:MAG TPA: hypothetical protein VJO72_05390 [Candidatus Dormibacteraeota bacterium]|nr:hypothetical protein [Candidatus Dormibacteraeota bacterium]
MTVIGDLEAESQMREACLLDQVGMLQMANDLCPNKLVEFICAAGWLSAAEMFRSQVQRQRMAACIVVIDTLAMNGCGSSSGLATFTAVDEVAQQVTVGADVAGAETSVDVMERLGASPGIDVNDGRDRNTNPFVARPGLHLGTIAR